jgi:hypothetical protein
MDAMTASKRFRSFSKGVLIFLHFSISLALTLDFLLWWQKSTPLEMAGMILIFSIGIPVMSWLLMTQLWSRLLQSVLQKPVSLLHRFFIFLCLSLDILAAFFLLTTNIGGLRSIQSETTRLIGFLIPGGHARFTGNANALSVNNAYNGQLLVNWTLPDGTIVTSTNYRSSNNPLPSGQSMTQAGITLRQMIVIPSSLSGNFLLSWSFSGKSTVFANSNTPSHIEVHGPGAGITVYVKEQPFLASGFLGLNSLGTHSPLFQLVKFKEAHRLITWLASFGLLFINYGLFIRVGITEPML